MPLLLSARSKKFPFSKSAVNTLNAYISPKRNISAVLFYAQVYPNRPSHQCTQNCQTGFHDTHTLHSHRKSCLSYFPLTFLPFVSKQVHDWICTTYYSKYNIFFDLLFVYCRKPNQLFCYTKALTFISKNGQYIDCTENLLMVKSHIIVTKKLMLPSILRLTNTIFTDSFFLL